MREKMREYIRFLEYEEKSRATREQYRRDIEKFLSFLGDRRLTKEVVIQYKELLQNRYQPGSVNTKLAAINGFFSFLGNSQLRVKLLKIQKKPFCSNEKRLSRAEYLRLVETAKQKGNEKLALIIQTICGTGIRVSELQLITTEAVASFTSSPPSHGTPPRCRILLSANFSTRVPYPLPPPGSLRVTAHRRGARR